MFFIVNESARFALVRRYSPVESSRRIIVQVFKEIQELQLFPWFARVPTCCNPADAPSRDGLCTAASTYGAQIVRYAF